MSFPPTWQDFVAQYQFRDSEEVYTNGSKLIPVFRIEQMMEHYHERIEKENERLVIKLDAEHIARQNTEIENAKLRELVRHMGACIQYLDRSDEDGGCVLCPYQSVEHDCEFESRMLELGIEVD